MTGSGGVGDGAPDRPLCPCHGEPMRWRTRSQRPKGGSFVCVVHARTSQSQYDASPKRRAKHARYTASPKGRARQARYRASPKGRTTAARAIYARGRRKLRARIERKRQRLEEMERHLAEEDTRGAGEGEDHQGHPHPDPPEALTGGR